MTDLICPVCGGDLIRVSNTLRCENRHSYDIARQGYVNLLMSNRSSLKHHGDDKLMVNARRDFLDRGYYEPLRDAVVNAVVSYSDNTPHIVDSGCGDCWYTLGVLNALTADGKAPVITGIDISKDALIAGGRRSRDFTLCVASASRLPVRTSSADLLLNIFSPLEPEEFSRVLKPGGYLIRAVPMERHLWSLKKAIYDNPYENPPANLSVPGFELEATSDVLRSITIDDPEDIQNLFKMTPYYYKTGREDQEKLSNLDSLTVELEVIVAVYKKA
jgi:23S rRNA (guanine745-N1)-methyltransferase